MLPVRKRTAVWMNDGRVIQATITSAEIINAQGYANTCTQTLRETRDRHAQTRIQSQTDDRLLLTGHDKTRAHISMESEIQTHTRSSHRRTDSDTLTGTPRETHADTLLLQHKQRQTGTQQR